MPGPKSDCQISCPNDGCNETFGNRMAKKRHLDNNKCLGVPKDKQDSVVKCANGSFQCTLCNKFIKQQNNVSRHRKICKGSEHTKPVWQCDFCDLSYPFESKLKKHMLVHDKHLLICPKCNKLYKRLDHFSRHIQSCDDFVPSFGNEFETGDSFGVHNTTPSLLLSQQYENYNLNDDLIVADSDPPVIVVDDVEVDFDIEMYQSNLTSTSINSTHLLTIDVDSLSESTPLPSEHVLDDDDDDKMLTDQTVPSLSSFETSKSETAKYRFCYRKYEQIMELLKGGTSEEKERVINMICKTQEEMQMYLSSNAKYLSSVIRAAKRSASGKVKAKRVFQEIYGDNLNSYEFLLWLSKFLKTSVAFMSVILGHKGESQEKPGRKLTPKNYRQEVYDFWKANAEVSVHRSNDRHIKKILERNIKVQVKDLDDPNITDAESKKGPKKKAHKLISLEPYHVLHKIYCDTHQFSPSMSLFMQLKPFYIANPTEKEVEMCMCSSCLNPHSLYKAIKNVIDIDVPYSLTSYLNRGISCSNENDTEFVHVDCIRGKCSSNCKPLDIVQDLAGEIKKYGKKLVSYYIFERVDTTYFDSTGTLKTYKRTTRVDKKEPFIEVVHKLQSCSRDYLLHRYRITNDKVHWAKLLHEVNHPILWLDYSNNINFREKRQAQSAYYSGKQQTLHCSIIKRVDGTNVYIYHLSDDTNHDAVFTFAIIRDIAEKYPYLMDDGYMVIRSDNCEDQYKCKFTFQQMREMAMKQNINIFLFYGAPGHGRGLIDGMSSFGCKKPLRQAIVSKDMWFPSALSMVEFLLEYFCEDDSKKHYFIDERKLAVERRSEKKEFVVRPCRAYHLIAVSNEGKFEKRLYYKGEDLNKIFSRIEGQSSKILDEHEEVEDEDFNADGFALDTSTVAELVQAGTYVAIRSDLGRSLDSFFLVEVQETGIANKNMQDDAGHCIVEGERYALVLYLDKSLETKKYVKYVRPKKNNLVLIHMTEVFATNVLLDVNLKMDIAEYQSIDSIALQH